MKKYSITPSLLNSFLFYKTDRRIDKKEHFLKTLKKEFTSNEAIEKGQLFEKQIQDFTENKIQENLLSSNQLLIAKEVQGGDWQKDVRKEIFIHNKTFVLNGRCDIYKPEIIYDIKTTGKYEKDKFKDSMQHRIYMYCSPDKTENFEYLINLWGKEDNIIKEFYKMNELVENEIFNCVTDFIKLMNINEEMLNIYKEKWLIKEVI